MTDDQIAAIVREFLAAASADAQRQAALLTDRLRGAGAPQEEGLEFVALCVAAFDSGISESRLRDLCKLHPLDTPSGFGFKEGGRWKVHQARYRAFCAANPRKGRRKR